MKKIFLASFFILSSLLSSQQCTLDEIALKTGTDKSSAYHDYTHVYDPYFSPLRNKPLKFLEIGIFQGVSVRMWEEYFPNAELHFIDINPSTILHYSTRCCYHFLDQEKVEELNRFILDSGGEFDIIIDDGGHTMQQQIVSFKTLFPHLKSGGMYIIENLQTSYWKDWGGGGTRSNPLAGKGTTVDFLEKLVDEMNYVGAITGCFDPQKAPESLKATLNEYQASIYSIHFYSNLCIVLKSSISQVSI